MPRGDRTGPFGEGPKTGRQMGYCTGNEGLGLAGMQTNWKRTGRGFGHGFEHGFGRGAGFRHGSGRIYEEIPEVSEKKMIENKIRILKDQMSSLEDRLSKLGEG